MHKKKDRSGRAAFKYFWLAIHFLSFVGTFKIETVNWNPTWTATMGRFTKKEFYLF